MTWSQGQQLALDQLKEIVAESEGALSIVRIIDPKDDTADAKIDISISTAHYVKDEGGLPLRTRERLMLNIPHRFPLDYPATKTRHKRFAGFSHVQWTNSLCLYQSSEIEWSPSDGMYGFIQRLNQWLSAGALNNLDPEDAPLHPPAIYPTSNIRIVARANAPVVVDGALNWIGCAHLENKTETRFDIIGWSPLSVGFPELPERTICAPAVMLNKPLPMEYPDTVFNLIMELNDRELSIDLLFSLLKLYALNIKEGDPLYMVLGAPMRRVKAGDPLKQHLSVWQIEPEATDNLRQSLLDKEDGDAAHQEFLKWAVTAKTSWCRVHEGRAEVTLRRDLTTTVEWLREKQILLLGCGALGSYVAEYLTRAGVAKLTLVDRAVVTPGVLVRQLHDDSFVGFSKGVSLKHRLDAIKMEADITSHFYNLKDGVHEKFDLHKYDLVIDATASRLIARVLENELTELNDVPPIASLSVSAKAGYGMVMVRMGRFTGGPVDISRRAKLAASRSDRAKCYANIFWPKRDDVSLFQPEPGCSEPTFIGSASDMAIHSGALLNLALERISALNDDEASSDFTAKVSINSPVGSPAHVGFVFDDVKHMTEPRYDYRVQVSSAAQRCVDAFIRQNARENGAENETGGLIFGEIDEHLKTIWLDDVTAPPPDSVASERQFLCGIEGTKEAAESRKEMSGGSLRFIGMWHTHPVSRPQPSRKDFKAMVKLLQHQQKPPRHIVMMIIGHSATDPEYAVYLYRRQEFLNRGRLIYVQRAGDHGED